MNHKKRFSFLNKKSIHTLFGFVMAAAVIIPGLSGCLRDGGPSFQDGDLWVLARQRQQITLRGGMLCGRAAAK